MKHTSTAMEHSIPFQAQIILCWCWSCYETKNKYSWFAMGNYYYNMWNLTLCLLNPMIQILKSCLHKQLIQIPKANLNFRNTAIFVINPTTLSQDVFENNEKMEKENGFFSRWELPVKSSYQYLKADQNQNLPYEKPSSYPESYYSRTFFYSRNCFNSRNRSLQKQSSRFRLPSISWSRQKCRSRYRYCDRRKITLTEIHHIQDTLIFIYNEEILVRLVTFFPEMFFTVLFLDLPPEIDSISEIIVLRIDFRQEHDQDLHLHLEVLPEFHNQILLEIILIIAKLIQVERQYEVTMYIPETTSALAPIGWFYILCIHSQNETDSYLPSRLEIVFLLDSRGYIFNLKFQVIRWLLRCSTSVINVSVIH